MCSLFMVGEGGCLVVSRYFCWSEYLSFSPTTHRRGIQYNTVTHQTIKSLLLILSKWKGKPPPEAQIYPSPLSPSTQKNVYSSQSMPFQRSSLWTWFPNHLYLDLKGDFPQILNIVYGTQNNPVVFTALLRSLIFNHPLEDTMHSDDPPNIWASVPTNTTHQDGSQDVM